MRLTVTCLELVSIFYGFLYGALLRLAAQFAVGKIIISTVINYTLQLHRRHPHAVAAVTRHHTKLLGFPCR